MTRDPKPQGTTDKRNEYAYWAIPGAAATVTYSLPLFHEIDFAVNEGYRKIPHGGIEEGGLLYGIIDEKGTRIDAFRPIVCEHASGPSFLLSDHDLDVLHAQIENPEADPELEGIHVVGWFLAHTRGPLTLTDREVELCNLYFNHPGMITVLVKPERFQPTRFGFLVRAEDGSLPRDGVQNAVILPLPGRNTKTAGGPIASIPAPTLTNIPAARRPAEAEDESEDPAPTLEPTSVAPPASSSGTAKPPNRAARRQRRQNEISAQQDEEELSLVNAKEEQFRSIVPLASDAARRGPLTLRPLPNEEREMDVTPDAYQQAELLNQKRTPSSAARMVMVLPLAALLGCLVGWLAFLQVPPPIIPMAIKPLGENVVVSWPPEQTRNSIYAAVRVDDSTPVPLTPEEKSTGRVEVQARPDMKVELIARNWIRDSRGIVHYLKPVANTGR